MATVMGVFAHPDDETFIAGGTFARLAAEGHRVVIACATRGEMGRRLGVPLRATRESLGALREQELREACAALGVSRLVLLGYRDKEVEMVPEDEGVSRLASLFAEERPDAIITFHDPLGGHPDHAAIGRLATSTFARYRRMNEGARLFYLAWGDDLAAFRRYPQPAKALVEVDVRAYRRQKLLAFRAHRTQSELDAAIWGNEEKAVHRMRHREYFVLSQGPNLRRPGTLID
ncbi:PIG-L family deacetylase [Alicyclobacillus acidocaldarius]|uniref:LmbE family protein n=1 Tax=Alicyclobacillus acidocaldarius (strain Tc-4-1) TaxID=1048834 RepID=F8IFU6_ALIAT|nr:PIG-L family deacetylase [Alicyclobacillus acidocaldarius]AEJ42917.1 LmbE family protein [Alicyclobacillus acidocaldarius subsp. acidocaldarius Tc-4-1]